MKPLRILAIFAALILQVGLAGPAYVDPVINVDLPDYHYASVESGDLIVSLQASEHPPTRNELPREDVELDSSLLPSFKDLDSEELDQFIIDFMYEHHIPGLTASIVKDGNVLWTGAYGYAYYSIVPAIDSTLFMLASVSKTLTGVALMQLYDQMRFALDDPVNDYLPFAVHHPSHPHTAITFRTILTHTSGIRDNWGVMPYYPGDSPIPLGEYLRDYLTPRGAYYNPQKNFYAWEPGTGDGYSNIAVALAGYLVEVISGTRLESYCQEHLFLPLGMKETSYFLAGLNSRHVAMPYYWNENTYIPLGHFGYSDYPSGQIRTSSPQLLRFLTAFMQYGQLGDVRILKSRTVALMTTPQYPRINPSQGLIWYNWNLGRRSLWGHDGGDPGVTTEMWYSPDENTGVVVLTNGESYFFEILYALFEYAEGP
jgi:CubicO group peptidase (beta-lactamase class C family)